MLKDIILKSANIMLKSHQTNHKKNAVDIFPYKLHEELEIFGYKHDGLNKEMFFHNKLTKL